MMAVGQDELVLLIEYMDNEAVVPKEIFVHLNNIYTDAKKGKYYLCSSVQIQKFKFYYLLKTASFCSSKAASF